MLRSLLVPGWGQYHNGAWYKALAVAGGEVWLGAKIVKDKAALDDLLAEVEAAQAAGDKPRYDEAVNSYNDRLDTYVGHQWVFGAVLAYALIDAYVDAHFRSFDIEFRQDPALPEEDPEEPDAPKQGGPAPRGGTRLALRWHF
jgi:hypothetical protein